MNKKLLIALPLVAVVMFNGCATLFGGGKTQNISIYSDKPMIVSLSHVSVDDNQTQTDGNQTLTNTMTIRIPTTVIVKREGKDLLLTSNDNEFEPILTKKKVNPWFWANILGAPAGTIFSSITDAATGALWIYDDHIKIPKND